MSKKMLDRQMEADPGLLREALVQLLQTLGGRATLQGIRAINEIQAINDELGVPRARVAIERGDHRPYVDFLALYYRVAPRVPAERESELFMKPSPNMRRPDVADVVFPWSRPDAVRPHENRDDQRPQAVDPTDARHVEEHSVHGSILGQPGNGEQECSAGADGSTSCGD